MGSLGARRLRRDGGGGSGESLLAAFVALQAFAGHQQTLAYSLLLAAAYAVAMALAARETRARYLWSRSLSSRPGVLLAAVQILPTFELLRNSLRAEAIVRLLHLVLAAAPLLADLLRALRRRAAATAGCSARPTSARPSTARWSATSARSALMLALAVAAVRRDARTKFWAAAALVCLLLALGRYAPLGLYKLIYHVPVLNLFRVPARHLMEVEFALAVLAGRGLTALAVARAGARALGARQSSRRASCLAADVPRGHRRCAPKSSSSGAQAAVGSHARAGAVRARRRRRA